MFSKIQNRDRRENEIVRLCCLRHGSAPVANMAMSLLRSSLNATIVLIKDGLPRKNDNVAEQLPPVKSKQYREMMIYRKLHPGDNRENAHLPKAFLENDREL